MRIKNDVSTIYWFWFFMLISFCLKSQNEVDCVSEDFNECFEKYEKDQDIDILFSIGSWLPSGIYVLNSSRDGHLDYEYVRKIRTELYLRWLDELLIAGRKIGYNPLSYDPNHPANLCMDTNSTIVFDPSEEYLNSVELSKKNCELKYYHDRFTRIMQSFSCFYRRSFLKHGKRRGDLEIIALDWCNREISSPNQENAIVEIILSNARRKYCEWY